MGNDLTARNSAPLPSHWRLATEDWIPAYCKKARINSVAVSVPSKYLLIFSHLLSSLHLEEVALHSLPSHFPLFSVYPREFILKPPFPLTFHSLFPHFPSSVVFPNESIISLFSLSAFLQEYLDGETGCLGTR